MPRFCSSLAGALATGLLASGAAIAQAPPPDQVYEYDARGRLDRVTYSDCSSIIFAYDLNNNRTSRVVSGATCVNQSPSWSSSTSRSVQENQTSTGYVAVATDPDNDPLSYSIASGVDASRFSINASSGVLTFNSPPNFEAPTDSGANNVYNIVLRASDGQAHSDRAVAISVTNANEAPVWLSGTAVSVSENQVATGYSASTSDPEGDTRTYSVVGGVDASKFSVEAPSGVLSFVAAPDFEAPTDSGGNNVYNVTIRASDGFLSADRGVAVTVTDVAEQANQAPAAVNDSATVGAGAGRIIYVLANDSDADGDSLTISFVSSPSKGTATIQSSGSLYWIQYTAYGFASGTDSFTYTASDGNGGTANATVQITIDGSCTGLCL